MCDIPMFCDSRTTLSSSAQSGPLCSGNRLRHQPLSPGLPCKALASGTLGEVRLYLWFAVILVHFYAFVKGYLQIFEKFFDFLVLRPSGRCGAAVSISLPLKFTAAILTFPGLSQVPSAHDPKDERLGAGIQGRQSK